MTRAFVFGALCVLAWLAAASAHAQVNVVTVTLSTDGPISNPNGCMLRDAIQAINLGGSSGGCTAGAGNAYRLVFTPTVTTVVLTHTGGDEDGNLSGDLDLTRAVQLHILGPVTITAAPSFQDRLFDIRSGATVTFENVTLANGRASDQETDPSGAGPGGTFITPILPYNNTCTRGGGAVRAETGGATLVFSNTDVVSNTTGFGFFDENAPPNSIYPLGGGLCAITATVLVRDSRWISNATVNMYDYYGGGGAIFVRGGNVHVERSRFVGNQAQRIAGTPSQIGVAGDQLWITGTTFERGLGGAYIRITTGTLVVSDVVITGSFPVTQPLNDGVGFQVGHTRDYFTAIGEARAQIMNARVSNVFGEALFIDRCSYAAVRDSVFTQNGAGVRIRMHCGGDRGMLDATNLRLLANEESGVIAEGGLVVMRDSEVLSHYRRSGIIGGTFLHLSNTLVANNAHTQLGGVPPDTRLGGGIHVWMGGIALTNTRIVSNYAPVGGGGIYLGQGTLSMNNVAILSNTTDIHGGGVYLDTSASGRLVNATFSGNRAYRGGGIYTLGTLFVQNSVFTNNSVEASGGAVFAGTNSVLHLADTQVMSNFAEYTGGGLLTDLATVFITRAMVAANAALGNGGGMQVFRSTIILSRTGVMSNAAEASGGGIAANASTVRMTASDVVSNAAKSSGGGVYATTGSRVALVNGARVAGNASTIGGGIYAANGSTVAVSDAGTLIGHNVARREGGGIALYVNSEAFLTQTAVLSNSSQNGGGLFVNQSRASLQGASLYGNVADQRGGGIYADDQSTVVVRESTLEQNGSEIGEGGGLFAARGSQAHLERSAVIRNRPSGVRAQPQGGLAPSVVLTNVTLSANQDAALESFSGAVVRALHTTVASQTVGARVGSGGVLTFAASILAYNGQNCVGAVAAESENLSSDATCATFTLTNANPLLRPLAYNGGSTLNHAIPRYSPAADRLSGSGVAVDQRGVARPQGGGYDLGAYEVESTELRMVKQASTVLANPGDTVTFTVIVINAGPLPTTDVVITDVLSHGAVFSDVVGHSANASVQVSATRLTVTVASLAVGEAATVTYRVRVPTATLFANQATVASALHDFTPSDNTASVTVRTTNLAVSKAAEYVPAIGETITPGGRVTYTVVVTNLSPVALTNVSITDDLPAGVSLVSAQPASCVASGQQVVCALGDLSAGQSATAQLVVNAPPTFGTVFENVAAAGAQNDARSPVFSNAVRLRTLHAALVPIVRKE